MNHMFVQRSPAGLASFTHPVRRLSRTVREVRAARLWARSGGTPEVGLWAVPLL